MLDTNFQNPAGSILKENVPTYFGKPYKETVEMIGEAMGFKNDEMCIFGDRLYTDIALGKKFGVTAVLVLSGETQPADVDKMFG